MGLTRRIYDKWKIGSFTWVKEKKYEPTLNLENQRESFKIPSIYILLNFSFFFSIRRQVLIKLKEIPVQGKE